MGHFVISPEGAIFLLVIIVLFILIKIAVYAVLGFAAFSGWKSRASWGRPVMVLAGIMIFLLVLAEFIPAMIDYPATFAPPLCEAHVFFPLSWGGGASNVITPCYNQAAVFHKSASLCRTDDCVEEALEAGATDCAGVKIHEGSGIMCYSFLAFRTGNYSYCDFERRETKLRCYTSLGKRLNDTAVCERLPPGPWKTDNIECIYSILRETRRYDASCGNLQKTGFESYCTAQKDDLLSDDRACPSHLSISELFQLPLCQAINSLDDSVCEIYSDIQAPELVEICAKEVGAVSSSNLSACEDIPAGYPVDVAQCIHQVNLNSGVEPDCAGLGSDILQKFCLSSQEAIRNESCSRAGLGYYVECVGLFSNDPGNCDLLSGDSFGHWTNPKSDPSDCKWRMERAGK
ncbi:MAG: hypothetical protein AB1324_02560 [Candidatus Micrarchaeota archaeon]